MQYSSDRLEDSVILRVPPEIADKLREFIAVSSEGSSSNPGDFALLPVGPEDGSSVSGRQFAFVMGSQVLPAHLVDLPCIVEAQKTFDNKSFYKSSDISQMVIVSNSAAPFDPKGQYAYPDGLTPPTKNIRARLYEQPVHDHREVMAAEKEIADIANGKKVIDDFELIEIDDPDYVPGDSSSSSSSSTSSASTSSALSSSSSSIFSSSRPPVAPSSSSSTAGAKLSAQSSSKLTISSGSSSINFQSLSSPSFTSGIGASSIDRNTLISSSSSATTAKSPFVSSGGISAFTRPTSSIRSSSASMLSPSPQLNIAGSQTPARTEASGVASASSRPASGSRQTKPTSLSHPSSTGSRNSDLMEEDHDEWNESVEQQLRDQLKSQRLPTPPPSGQASASSVPSSSSLSIPEASSSAPSVAAPAAGPSDAELKLLAEIKLQEGKQSELESKLSGANALVKKKIDGDLQKVSARLMELRSDLAKIQSDST